MPGTERSWAQTARTAVGAALLVGAYVPLHRLLDSARAGPAGEATRATAEAAWGTGLYGSLLVVGAALAFALLVPDGLIVPLLRRAGDLLSRGRRAPFAAGVGLLAGCLSLGIALALYQGHPTSVDEMAQLLHARALAAGRLAVPVPGGEAAWSIQNGLVTSLGWTSIYPPFHTLLLAVGLSVGAPWVVGPAALGVATWASALSFEELLGVRVGRAAGLALAVSPFWLLLGATYLSHATAAASLSLVLLTGLRARRCGLVWAVAAGASMGAAVSARPWVGLVCATVVLATLWGRERGVWARRLGGVVMGGAPFAALLFWWNTKLFGAPWRLGYSAAYGPAHGLGLHIDPWGNQYGATEAVAYTGADLVQLGAHLFETPLPALALVGLALVVGMRAGGTTPFLAWAASAIAANALYWHHGVHMGPRMLYESVPAWVALFAASAAFLAGDSIRKPTLRRMAAWTVATAGVGAIILAPGVFAAADRSGDDPVFATLQAEPVRPALVFVHGSWSSRVVARLSASGMRRDSVETALRRNDICAVDRYARWREAEPSTRAAPPILDLEALPGSPPHLRRSLLSPGNAVWADPRAIYDERCAQEARADQHGVVDLEPLAWQAPPLTGRELIVARDMGPELNAAVREAFGEREAFVFTPGVGTGEAPLLVGYDEGMVSVWGARADPSQPR